MFRIFFKKKKQQPPAEPDNPPVHQWTREKLLFISSWLSSKEQHLTNGEKKIYLILFLTMGACFFASIAFKAIFTKSSGPPPAYFEQPMFTPPMPIPPQDTGLRWRPPLPPANDPVQPNFKP